jgi:hypothetical protein
VTLVVELCKSSTLVEQRSFMSRRRGRAAAVAGGFAALVLASAAPAAAPTKDGQYAGTIAGTEKTFKMHVSTDGKTAIGTVYCYKQKTGTFPRFPITAGKFTATAKVGGVAVAVVKGTFKSATRVSANMNLSPDSGICDGKGGNLILKLKGT